MWFKIIFCFQTGLRTRVKKWIEHDVYDYVTSLFFIKKEEKMEEQNSKFGFVAILLKSRLLK